MTREFCSAHVFDGTRSDFTGHSCTRKIVIVRDGKNFCSMHDPEGIFQAKLKAKRDLDEKIYNARFELTHRRDMALRALLSFLGPLPVELRDARENLMEAERKFSTLLDEKKDTA